MRVAVLGVGTELVLGDQVDTNAAWILRTCRQAGLDGVGQASVGDDVDAIALAVGTALAGADAVIVTGGLGPTSDDLTREALARLAGAPLRRDAALEATLRSRFAEAGRSLPELALGQADLPRGARSLPNRVGTAPGLALTLPAGQVFAVPGVPREMRPMVAEQVLPVLLARAGAALPLQTRTLRTVGTGESDVARLLAGLDPGPGVDLSYLASLGEVRVRLSTRATDRAAAVEALAPLEAEVRARLGSTVYGVDDDSLAGVVRSLLLGRGETVAVAESLTGGLVAARMVDVPGASEVLRGGVLAYATDLKTQLLGVAAGTLAAHGPVSAEVATAMAEGVRARLGADWGVATTGVAGPAPQDGLPAGTVHLGLAGPQGSRSVQLQLTGSRDVVRERAVVAAWDLLRRALRGDSAVGAEQDG